MGRGASGEGSVIDVMVLYTASARSAVGGTAAMLAEIDPSMELANIAYEGSGSASRSGSYTRGR